jgi:hypothetical protein
MIALLYWLWLSSDEILLWSYISYYIFYNLIKPVLKRAFLMTLKYARGAIFQRRLLKLKS